MDGSRNACVRWHAADVDLAAGHFSRESFLKLTEGIGQDATDWNGDDRFANALNSAGGAAAACADVLDDEHRTVEQLGPEAVWNIDHFQNACVRWRLAEMEFDQGRLSKEDFRRWAEGIGQEAFDWGGDHRFSDALNSPGGVEQACPSIFESEHSTAPILAR